jgi:glucose/arabinose dehydrogenase
LDVNVANKYERGMIGIAVLSKEQQQQKQEQETGITGTNNTNTNNTNNTIANATYVYLYYTETDVEGSDVCPTPNRCDSEHKQLGNRLYRYEFVDNKLVNPRLLMDLPASPIPTHNGGKILIGPDKNVYFTIGDLNYKRSAQNLPDRPNSDTPNSNGTSAIYRITPDGRPVQPILGNEHPLDKYYAYGMRNSYGIDFDPVTGKLWDTENGPAFGDEINLVEPGFNSGWRKVQGVWDVEEISAPGGRANSSNLDSKIRLNFTDLEDFGGRGKYSSPEFTWLNVIGPTAIKFLTSDKLGKQYQNDFFVGDYHQGNIYHFKLNQNRTDLVLDGQLQDKVVNLPEELEGIRFGEGFGAITDIQIGPYDGYLYVVSYGLDGKIYRIVPATIN